MPLISNETQPVLGNPELVIITERVDDVALLIAQMIRMGLPKVLDKHIPQRGDGQQLFGWLTY